MKRNILFSLLLVAMLSACTVRTRHVGGTYEPSLANNYVGLLSIEISEDVDDVLPHMARVCARYGGYKLGSAARSPSPVGLLGWGNTYWKYQCNGLAGSDASKPKFTGTASRAQIPKETAPTRTISIEEAKRKCSELGFKEGTDLFAECGLKLIK